MKIENDQIARSSLIHKGVVETGRKNLKEAAAMTDENRQKPVDKKVFQNPESSSLKGFKIDRLA